MKKTFYSKGHLSFKKPDRVFTSRFFLDILENKVRLLISYDKYK